MVAPPGILFASVTVTDLQDFPHRRQAPEARRPVPRRRVGRPVGAVRDVQLRDDQPAAAQTPPEALPLPTKGVPKVLKGRTNVIVDDHFLSMLLALLCGVTVDHRYI